MKEKQAISLGVNIDHVATLRQARGTRYPEVIQAALLRIKDCRAATLCRRLFQNLINVIN